MGKEWMERLKPHSYQDYVRIGPLLIYRWLWVLLLGLLFTGIIVAAGVSLLETQEQGGIQGDGTVGASAKIPAFRWDAEGLAETTGLVQIVDEAGVVRFMGEVRAGVCTGQGTVFDENSKPVYVGMLADNQYQGEGTLLASDGTTLYEGEFAANKPHGKGVLLDPETGVSSRGDFLEGAFTGEGSQLRDGVLLREGTFEDGLLSGEGQEYHANGSLLREGYFDKGLLSGAGTDYSPDEEVAAAVVAALNDDSTGSGVSDASSELAADGGTGGADGQSDTAVGNSPGNSESGSPVSADGAAQNLSPIRNLRLEGFFEKGKLEGAGRAYMEGALVYEGAFHEGEFQGDGTLRDSKTQRIRYTGNFFAGMPSGVGRLYDEQGRFYYSGQVYQGKIDLLSFLGSSLAQLETAFQTHFRIYACGERTAFVYPEQGLAFLTTSKVELLDPSASSEENVLDAPAWAKGSTEESSQAEEELSENQMLSEKTRSGEIIISQLIITGAEYPGLDGEFLFSTEEQTPPGAADYFAMHLLGLPPSGYEQLLSSEFVTLFAPVAAAETAEATEAESPDEKTGASENEELVILRETALQSGLMVESCTVLNRGYCLVSKYRL